jgi:MFS transporter, ACS family, D-galactonate transporter
MKTTEQVHSPVISSLDNRAAATRRTLGLLMLAIGINYIDRGSLAVAAPPLSAELAFSSTQMGLLFSSFFWSYAGCMVLAGWLLDRYSVKWVLGVGFFVWSTATASTAFAHSLYSLCAIRLLLGAGESVAFPAISKIIAREFPIEKRGWPNSLIDASVKIGPALGTLLGGLLVALFGWRYFFFVLGVGGLLWLLPWIIFAPEYDDADQPKENLGSGILQVLRQRDAWGTFLGNFCCNYAVYFLLIWLPSYLVKERHLSMSQMAILGSIPFWGSAMSSVLAGWTSDRWIQRGATPTRVRKTFVVGGLLMSTLMLPAALAPSLTLSLGLLIVANLAFGLFSSNHWAITQTLAGPKMAGVWTGLQNAIANLAGILAPIITGIIVDKTGSFFFAFLSSSIVVVVGAASYLFLVGPVAPVSWERDDQVTAARRG